MCGVCDVPKGQVMASGAICPTCAFGASQTFKSNLCASTQNTADKKSSFALALFPRREALEGGQPLPGPRAPQQYASVLAYKKEFVKLFFEEFPPFFAALEEMPVQGGRGEIPKQTILGLDCKAEETTPYRRWNSPGGFPCAEVEYECLRAAFRGVNAMISCFLTVRRPATVISLLVSLLCPPSTLAGKQPRCSALAGARSSLAMTDSKVLILHECLEAALKDNHRRTAPLFAVAMAEAQHRQALAGYRPWRSLKAGKAQ